MKFFKITEEVIEEYGLDDIVGKLEEKPRQIIDDMVTRYKGEIMESLLNCESPIEMILSLALKDCMGERIYSDVDILGIDNQVEITVGDKVYRTDIVVAVHYEKVRRMRRFLIECNGHEFHEKTKEQVARNNARERELIKEGYIVLNFSGSEIFNNPYACVREIKDIIFHYKELLEDEFAKSGR